MKSKYFFLGFLSFLLLAGASYHTNFNDLLKYDKKWISLNSRAGVSQTPGVSLITKFGYNNDLDATQDNTRMQAEFTLIYQDL